MNPSKENEVLTILIVFLVVPVTHFADSGPGIL